MSRVRVFVAAQLPDGILQEVGKLQTAMQKIPGNRSVRWVNSSGIHITFKFIGDTDADELPALARAIDSAALRISPIFTATGSLGCFPNQTRPRVIWLGLQDEQHGLRRAFQVLDDEMANAGIARDTRPFQPHLTLGRVRNGAMSAEVEALGRSIASWPALPPQPFEINEVALISSTLKPSGAEYTVLHHVRLAARPDQWRPNTIQSPSIRN
ncbi:MAG: RNA 2',3'-cyclic phosphodiesterase [Chloroflexi bacterium]|nr:RNA 2',3'-cyclic phosphodiesterase [Chloroflexota bacterium]